MCTDERRKVDPEPSPDGNPRHRLDEAFSDKAYLQLKPSVQADKAVPSEPSRIFEKVLYVITVITLVLLSHTVVSHQWILPWFYTCATPVLVFFKTVCYWRNKWQFFMIDFCYTANTIVLVYLGLPGNENLFRVAFALANGPVLMASVVYKNSLVFHNYDKVTSCYIHVLPALVTFCARWMPTELSAFWHKPFVPSSPEFDLLWLYAVPFACFFLHSCCYFLIVNVVVRPKDPYITSYKYLAEKYDKLNFIKGPFGQGIVFYGFNWLFCLVCLLMSLLCYCSFTAHCLILTVVFTVVLYNGAGYTMHIFNKLANATEP